MAPSKVLASQRRRAKPRPNGRGPARGRKKETTARTKRKAGGRRGGRGRQKPAAEGQNLDRTCIQIAISTQNVYAGMRTPVVIITCWYTYHSANDAGMSAATSSEDFCCYSIPSKLMYATRSIRFLRRQWETSRDASAAPREVGKARQRRNRRPQMQMDTYLAMAVR